MLALSDDHVGRRSQEANGWSEGERVQQPQQHGEVVRAACEQRRCHQNTEPRHLPSLCAWSKLRLTFVADGKVTNELQQVLLRAVCKRCNGAAGAEYLSRDVKRHVTTMSRVGRLTLDDSTVCAGARYHPREDAIDLLQLFNSNIVKLVLTAQKKNSSERVHQEK